uniref:Myb/SANT-like domain-containing protein n=1 Tax=Fagus sylvatica TaxID=28930 RepID=A0A2N9EQR9_FAGSY
MVGKKEKQSKIKENQQTEDEVEEKSYVRWSLDMEHALADILRDERNLGNKGDAGWKTVAYNSASSKLSSQLHIDITADNVKNRIKTWKKLYGIVSDILSQSGFNWDATKKMMITVDDDNAWQEYIKSHKDARSFRWKVISNWDDIVDLCGKDRATGEGAETGEEADEIMTPIEESNVIDLDSETQASTSSLVAHAKKRMVSKDVLADSVAKMASSFQEFIRTSTQKLDAGEVYDEITAIPDLSEDEELKACAWFIENEKQFQMLKKVPATRKKSMVLMFISTGA